MASQTATSIICILVFLVSTVKSIPWFGSDYGVMSMEAYRAMEQELNTLQAELSAMRVDIQNWLDENTKINELLAAVVEFDSGALAQCTYLDCPTGNIGFNADLYSLHCNCVAIKDLGYHALAKHLEEDGTTAMWKQEILHRRNQEVEPVSKETNFTYVPPPKTDITPQLIAQSLAVQPQDTATVGSVMSYFQAGVIVYGIQLNAMYASILMLNASVDLPCDGIGGQAQLDLVLRPKDIDNGTVQVYVPDCHVVAVNMLDPNVITYWVQKHDGSIHTLVGSNKVVNIDQLNTTESAALVLRAIPAGSEHLDSELAEVGQRA